MLIGLAWSICAVICFVGLKHVEPAKKKAAIGLCVFFAFFGACGVLGGLLKSPILLATAMLLSVAILCIAAFGMAFWNQRNCKTQITGVYLGFSMYKGRKGHRSYSPIFKYFFKGTWYQRNCKTQITGVYLGFRTHRGRKGRRSYYPIFKYYFRGNWYQNWAYENYSLKKINERFKQGQAYPIWTSEKRPDAFITRRNLDAKNIIVLLVGLFMLCIYGGTLLVLLVIKFAPQLGLNI